MIAATVAVYQATRSLWLVVLALIAVLIVLPTVLNRLRPERPEPDVGAVEHRAEQRPRWQRWLIGLVEVGLVLIGIELPTLTGYGISRPLYWLALVIVSVELSIYRRDRRERRATSVQRGSRRVNDC